MFPNLTGYWQSWNLPGQDYLPITSVPSKYINIIIAFVASNEEGSLFFAGPNIPTKQEIYNLQQQGHNVLLSIGGGGYTVTLDTPEKEALFSESLYRTINELGVNGIDIDVEYGMPALGTPYQPKGNLLGLINVLDKVLSLLPHDFLLTLAPETINLVGGMTKYGDDWGNYLPFLLHFGDRISQVHMQYYNTGSMYGLDGQIYEPGTADFVVAMTEAIIKGFTIADTGVIYPGFPSYKTSIGLPATPEAAANGYLYPLQIEEVFCMLTTGRRGIGKPNGIPYSVLGGLMTWSIQWDALNNFNFMRNGYRILKSIF